MAASLRRVALSWPSNFTGIYSLNHVVFQKRFLRVDPEEELERLFIKKSFEERMADLKPRNEKPKVIGADTDAIYRNASTNSSSISSTTPTPRNTGINTTTRSKRLRSKLGNAGSIFSIPLGEVQRDSELESGADRAVSVLRHYKIYEHLFDDNVLFYLRPDTQLDVMYPMSSDDVLPVFRGNKITPSETTNKPLIRFKGKPSQYYSLLMINIDGHLGNTNREYLHWYHVNMVESNQTESGTSCEYLQAIPVRGTGFHRYVFLLLEHSQPIDVSLLPNVDPVDLETRDFKFAHFFSKLSNDVHALPVAIQFFQSEWDDTVRQVFHDRLDMPEPSYEYDFPDKQHKQQIKYPKKQPFQSYLDRYRDRKEIAEEALKEHLSEINPFKPLDEQVLPYPLATPTKPGLYAENLPPTWIQTNLRHKANKTDVFVSQTKRSVARKLLPLISFWLIHFVSLPMFYFVSSSQSNSDSSFMNRFIPELWFYKIWRRSIYSFLSRGNHSEYQRIIGEIYRYYERPGTLPEKK